MPRALLISSLAVALALAAACSGAPTSNLFSGATGGDNNDSGSDASSGGSSGSPRPDSGPALDSAAGTFDTSAESSADTEAGDAIAAEAAGPDASVPGVSCPSAGQTTTCQSGEICCISTAGLTQSGRCQQLNAPTPCTGIPVGCSSPADCKTGEVCCGTETATLFGTTTYQNVTCKTSCAGFGQVAFCDPTVGGCGVGTSCQTSTLVPAYTVCR